MERCLHCGSDDLYTRKVASAGGYGPKLLAGLGSFLHTPEFDVVLCAACGRCEFFADQEARKKVKTAASWKRLQTGA